MAWHAQLEAQAPQSPRAAASQVPPQALAQIGALMAEKLSRTPVQRKIDSRLLYGARIAAGRAIAAVSTLRITLPMTADGRAMLDVRARVSDALLGQLRGLGAEITDSNAGYAHVGIRVPLDRVEAIAALPDVTWVAPQLGAMTSRTVPAALQAVAAPSLADRVRKKTLERADLIASLRAALERRTARFTDRGAIANAGSVTSEGDVTHRAVDARTAFGAIGTGVKIGVLSDGVDSLAASQASGDLGPVTVLAPGSGDEGTAMLEIVHDLAPGAQLFFATAFVDIANFADNIRALRNAGCDIIVDDVFYFVETPFQDGQTAASPTNGGVVIQAVKDVAASGALYFSSAGNSGAQDAGSSGTWEGDFVDGGDASTLIGFPGRIHSFGTTPFNTIMMAGALTTLYWSDPLNAAADDYDLFLVDSAGNVVDSSTNVQEGVQDPFEFVDAGIDGDRLVVVKFSGAGRFLHLSTNRGILAMSTGGQIHGHAATTAPNTFGVAATPACTGFGSTGPCGSSFTAGSKVETFSSDGPRRVFYNSAGAPFTPGNLSSTGGTVLQKPDITAADGVTTSVAGFNPFFGTSAAAPHAAAIAGLVKSRNLTQTASQISATLTSTAIDLNTPGWDRDAGFGLVMAFQAVAATPPPPGPPQVPTGLALTRTGPSTATATWNGANGATSYNLKFSFTAGAAKNTIVSGPATTVGVTGLLRGQTYFFVVSASNASGSSADSPEVPFFIPGNDTASDFDADLHADLTVWHPANGTWSWLTSGSGFNPARAGSKAWGASTDTPLSGDIDGDGRPDLIVWRPSTGTWFWLTSSTGYNYASQGSKQWGASTDIPLVGDLDGDGKADLVVWRPDSGTWFWLTSSSGYDYPAARALAWGTAGDVPLLGDFDGDGKADLTVWRGSSGVWFWLTSSTGYAYASAGARQWGSQSAGDRPMLGDFDGDGRADLAVWRAPSGTWFWITSSTAYDYGSAGVKQWGSQALSDVPLLADLDGDRRAELIVWRPGSGIWFSLSSTSGFSYAAQTTRQWGTSGDVPIVK